MKIGDLVLHQGRPYYLRGFDPIGVPNGQAFLEDPSSGAELLVPASEVGPEGTCGPDRLETSLTGYPLAMIDDGDDA